MNKMTVKDIDVAGKRVLVRVDFNVPLDTGTGAITDDSRIRASLPTIKYLLEHKAKVILMSHLGRPKGKPSQEFSLAPIAERLSQILKKTVIITADCVGSDVEKSAASMKAGDVLLLENLRFHAGEEAGEESFAKALARLGDIFVNDAFGTAHRAHASTAVITKYLPSVAGLLMEKEIITLGNLLKNPEHPFICIFGGAKVSDKVGVLKNIMDKVDCLLIGGGMAATFLKAKSYNVGTSAVEAESLTVAGELIKQAAERRLEMVLPIDFVVAAEIDSMDLGEVVLVSAVPPDKKIVDIGPETLEIFRKELEKAQTVFWNGPMGVHEIPQFAGGTESLARLLASLKAKTIVGGGSTAEVIEALGLNDKITFVSTGGGASLEFLGGKQLPGVVSLLDKK
jgi:phosphoglycerate kinase